MKMTKKNQGNKVTRSPKPPKMELDKQNQTKPQNQKCERKKNQKFFLKISKSKTQSKKNPSRYPSPRQFLDRSQIRMEKARKKYQISISEKNKVQDTHIPKMNSFQKSKSQTIPRQIPEKNGKGEKKYQNYFSEKKKQSPRHSYTKQ